MKNVYIQLPIAQHPKAVYNILKCFGVLWLKLVSALQTNKLTNHTKPSIWQHMAKFVSDQKPIKLDVIEICNEKYEEKRKANRVYLVEIPWGNPGVVGWNETLKKIHYNEKITSVLYCAKNSMQSWWINWICRKLYMRSRNLKQHHNNWTRIIFQNKLSHFYLEME